MSPTFHHYHVYGLHLASEVAFPSLRAAPPGTPDLVVRCTWAEALPDWHAHGQTLHASPAVTTQGVPYLRVVLPEGPGVAPWLLRHTSETGAVDFRLHRDPAVVEVTCTGAVAARDLEAYFTGAVLGHCLRMIGYTCLHGGFLTVGGAAVGVIGAKGAGKSSLTAAGAQAGLPVLADDVGVLDAVDGVWHVRPAYPRLRLWPATLAALGMAQADALEAVLSFADKRYLDLRRGPWRHDAMPRPLRAVLVLGPRRGGAPEVVRLAPGAALAALLAHVYAPRAGAAEARARDLARLSALCRAVPVYQVALPLDIAWLRAHAAPFLEKLTC